MEYKINPDAERALRISEMWRVSPHPWADVLRDLTEPRRWLPGILCRDCWRLRFRYYSPSVAVMRALRGPIRHG